MSLGILLLALIIAGLFAVFRLKGKRARTVKTAWAWGLILTLGGCTGVIGWIGAETSGRNSIFNDFNPYIWVGIACAGILVLVVASLSAIVTRAAQPPRADAADRVADVDNGQA